MANSDQAAPDEDLVRLYLNDIGQHDLLSKEDEAHLGETRLAGLEAAAELGRGTSSPARKRELRRLVQDGEGAKARLHYGLDGGEPNTLEDLGQQLSLTGSACARLRPRRSPS